MISTSKLPEAKFLRSGAPAGLIISLTSRLSISPPLTHLIKCRRLDRVQEFIASYSIVLLCHPENERKSHVFHFEEEKISGTHMIITHHLYLTVL